MIEGRDFLVLSDDWNGLPTSTIHLFRHIGRRNRVFWLNVTTRMPRGNWSDAKKVFHTLWNWGRQRVGRKTRGVDIAITARKLPVVRTPLMIPWFRPVFRRMNAASLTRTHKRIRAQFRITDPILITTFPCVVDFVREVPAALKLYSCVDDWTQYPSLDGALWHAMEKDLLDTVDGFIVTSRDLQAKCRPTCPSLYLPHGVDFLHFHEATEQLQALPEMERIPKPIVGFFGIIADWVDLDLVAILSRAFSAVSFVLVGPAGASLAPIANCPNIYYLGPKPYAELPKYARYFNVGLIPFLLNKLTEAVNPLKLFEYYALGLPVLATRLPELERADGPLSLASTEGEFREGLQCILSDTNARSGAWAVEVAKRNAWQQRAEELSDFITGLA